MRRKEKIRSITSKPIKAVVNTHYTKPDVTFDDKYELENGKIQVLYFGPGHTEEGVVVYFPEEKILFGDCMVKEKLGWLGDGNVERWPLDLGSWSGTD